MCKLPPCNVSANDQARFVWWSKATTEQLANYKQCLSDKLAGFAMTELYDCLGCTSPVHLHAIDNCAARLQATLIQCSHACIPRKRAASSKKYVAGWNSECSDLRKQSIAWHNMWVQAGRPNTGVIANIMRATRKKYHLNSKQVLRSQNDLHNANIANAHYTSSYDFWSEVKRASACNAKSNARVVINGLSSPPDIANAFKDVYENIFRAGFTSSDDIQRFRIELN